MKTKSISYIRNMLKKEETNARKEYNDFRRYLMEKYSSSWICREMNEMETSRLLQTQERLSEALKALEDFENHQWQ